jgi:hypothetical protein
MKLRRATEPASRVELERPRYQRGRPTGERGRKVDRGGIQPPSPQCESGVFALDDRPLDRLSGLSRGIIAPRSLLASASWLATFVAIVALK